jgi:hypothetical protein
MAMRDTYEIVEKEQNNQDQGKVDAATRKKFGPAASHQAGNPTSGGGINRPAKGKVS